MFYHRAPLDISKYISRFHMQTKYANVGSVDIFSTGQYLCFSAAQLFHLFQTYIYDMRFPIIYKMSIRQQSSRQLLWWIESIHGPLARYVNFWWRMHLDCWERFRPSFFVSFAVDPLRPEQNGRHFADFMFKYIFLTYNFWMLNKISLLYFP